MDVKEAIDILEKFYNGNMGKDKLENDNKGMYKLGFKYKNFELDVAIETVLSELEKKENIINLIAKQLVEAHGWFYSEFDNFKEEDWINYFTKKCEGK